MNDRNRTLKPFVPQPDDDMIICRCEEITKGEIRRAVHDGMFTLTEIRRYLRTGMGLCQGQTCTKLVKGIVARELGVRPNELEPATGRAPSRSNYCRRRHRWLCSSVSSCKRRGFCSGIRGQSTYWQRRFDPKWRRCPAVRTGPTGIAAGDVCDSKSVAEAVRYAGYKRRILSARKFAARQHASP